MARMHAGKKGKSGSSHPIIKVVPSWSQYSKEEIAEIIVKLAKEGKNTSEIGLILRDQYGVPSVKALCGKSISQILKAEKLYPEFPEDLLNLMKKAVSLHKHLQKNKVDFHNKRVFVLTESKIKRLVAYYKRKKIISEDWYYNIENATLIVKG